MAKILIIKSSHLPPKIEKDAEKENFSKKLWESFNSLDKFTKAFVIFILLFTIAVPVIKTQYFDTRQRAEIAGINTIDLSIPEGVSQLSTGVTHTQYSADSWNNSAAVISARQLLSSSTSFQNQHIMGWGALNPWPDSSITDPAKWNWESLDGRINLIRQTGGTPIITLCCSPDWMKGGVNGQTDWSKIEVAPLPVHEADFANLAKQVALRYSDVKYFQVWNEMKGMWATSPGCTPSVCGTNRWDYERYTRLYNLVYDAIKSVRPDVNIGGPYVVMDNWSSASQSNPSAVSGPYGVLDQRPMDVIKYWLQNKHGAEFITVDGGPQPKDNVWITDEFTAGQYFTDTINWIKSLDNTAYPGAKTLPIWWAEWYASAPSKGADINHDTAVMASDLIYTIKSGASLPLIWEPQGDANGFSFPVGIWTDTRITGGGQATPFYNVQKYFHDYFPSGTQLYKVTLPSNDIGVLASSLKTLLVNRTSISQTAVINGVTFIIGAYQVMIIDTPTPTALLTLAPTLSPTPTSIPTSIPTPTFTPIPTKTLAPTSTPIPVTQPVQPTNTPVPTNAGFVGSYFDNKDLTSLKFTRVDPTINFNWGKGSPNSLIGNDTFSIIWNGYIAPPVNNIYTFYAYSDDGVRVWVNNQLIIDKWFNRSAREYMGTISLNGGQAYNIKVSYYENSGNAVIKLSWSSPNLPKQILGQPYLR